MRDSSTYTTIAYRNYAALCCVLTDEQTIQSTAPNSGAEQDRIADYFYENVGTYRKGLEKNFYRYARASDNSLKRKNETSAGGTDILDNGIPRHLYNVCCHYTYGYADLLKILLVDDVDPYFHLTTDLNLPINQVTLAFCPTIRSIGIESRPGEHIHDGWLRPNGSQSLKLVSPFVELHELLGQRPADHVWAPHPFEYTSPLLLFTRFKLGGLAVLSGGLDLRRSLLRAVSRAIVRTQARMLNRIGSNQMNILDVHEEDISSLRAGYLDCQGTEELGVYFLCTNYTVAMSAMVAISSLTFDDILLKGTADGMDTSQMSRLHTCMSEVVGDSSEEIEDRPTDEEFGFQEDRVLESPLSGNHVFASSYSILGVSRHTLLNEPGIEELVNGRVEVYGRVNVLSGHQAEIEERIKTILNDSSPLAGHEAIQWSDIQRVLVGRNDYDYSLAWTGPQQKIPTMGVAEFIKRARQVESEFVVGAGGTKRTAAHPRDLGGFEVDETGLLDISSGVVVPIPTFVQNKQSPSRSHKPIVPALRNATEALFGRTGILSDSSLRDACDILRMPYRLRRTLFHQLKNYRASLADPLMYDNALDLFDAVIALQRVVTSDLTHFVRLRQEIALGSYADASDEFEELLADHAAKQTFTPTRIDRLSQYIGALENAHSHRIHRHTKAEIHDWTIDIRGGLTQIVHGSAVPLLCSSRLLEWCRQHVYDDQSHSDANIGVLSRLSLHQRWRIHTLKLCTNQMSILAVVDLSVGHILNPIEYVDHFHEAGHLLLMMWDQSLSPKLSQRCQRDVRPSDLAEREEIFAELFTHLFVFGVDCDSYMKAACLSFGTSPASRNVDRSTAIREFLYFCQRIYFTCQAVRSLIPTTRNARLETMKIPERHPWVTEWMESEEDMLSFRDIINNHRKAYLQLVDEVGRYFASYPTLNASDEWLSGLQNTELFLDINSFDRQQAVFGDAWYRATTLYNAFTSRSARWKCAVYK